MTPIFYRKGAYHNIKLIRYELDPNWTNSDRATWDKTDFRSFINSSFRLII